MYNNNFFSHDPIEQFELTFSFISSFNSFVYLLLLNFTLIFLFFFNLGKKNFIGYLSNFFFIFVKTLFFNIFTNKHQGFFFFFYYLFLFIFINNVIGLLPFSYTLTAAFIMTFFYSFVSITSIFFYGFEQRKFGLFAQFFPRGIHPFIYTILIFLEVISFFIRFISLSVRLFANMVSGHILLKILLSFFWLGLSLSFSTILSLIFWVIILMITFLEMLIAFLQAYVFIFLVMIYLNEIV
jgi:F-type H+-transporting ATPase subunit a